MCYICGICRGIATQGLEGREKIMVICRCSMSDNTTLMNNLYKEDYCVNGAILNRGDKVLIREISNDYYYFSNTYVSGFRMEYISRSDIEGNIQ